MRACSGGSAGVALLAAEEHGAAAAAARAHGEHQRQHDCHRDRPVGEAVGQRVAVEECRLVAERWVHSVHPHGACN